MHLSRHERAAKLKELAASEGFDDVDELLAAAAHDSVSPGICTRPACSYTHEAEPDQNQGRCAECRAQTVHSALILAELI